MDKVTNCSTVFLFTPVEMGRLVTGTAQFSQSPASALFRPAAGVDGAAGRLLVKEP